MLTGTPLQNDLEELQNLLQFILVDVFSKEDINESEDLQVCTSLLLLLSPSTVLWLLWLQAYSSRHNGYQARLVTKCYAEDILMDVWNTSTPALSSQLS